MAKYIEFIGVSGVGKSTTYNSLTRYPNNSHYILCENLDTRKITFKQAFKSSLQTITSLEQPPLPGPDWKIIDRFCLNNPELVDLFWSNFSPLRKINVKDSRFHAVAYILKIMEKLQRVFDHPTDKFVLVDEGLIHNLNYFINSSLPNGYSEQINKATDLITLPAGVVYFSGDIQTVIERTSGREKINYRDNGLSSQELRDLREESIKEKETFIEAVVARNIPVLTLECKDSVPKKSEKIVGFVNHLK